MSKPHQSFILETSHRCAELTRHLNYTYPDVVRPTRDGVPLFLKHLTIMEINARLAWVVTINRNNYNIQLTDLAREYLGLNDVQCEEFLSSDALIDVEEELRVFLDKYVEEGAWMELYFKILHNGVLVINEGDYRVNQYYKHMKTIDPEVYRHENGCHSKQGR